MTNPIPDEAVEAVEAVLTDAGVDLYDNVHDLARLALTAAAPYIAAQALHRAEQAIDFETTCLRCGYLLGQMLDMHERVEALRDEWRIRPGADLLHDHADALDALLRGA